MPNLRRDIAVLPGMALQPSGDVIRSASEGKRRLRGRNPNRYQPCSLCGSVCGYTRQLCGVVMEGFATLGGVTVRVALSG